MKTSFFSVILIGMVLGILAILSFQPKTSPSVQEGISKPSKPVFEVEQGPSPHSLPANDSSQAPLPSGHVGLGNSGHSHS